MSAYRKARIRLALEPIAQAVTLAAMSAGLLAAFTFLS